MTMTHSAIYYPRTDIRSPGLMKSALLTWDEVVTIIPDSRYRPNYADKRDMAEAWELIGEGHGHVPAADEQGIAHDSIKAMLAAGLPAEFAYLAQRDAKQPYEIWPQKFALETWNMMRAHGMADLPMPHSDYHLSHEGGVMAMSKLADAIGQDKYVRITDQSLAFAMAPDPSPDKAAEEAMLIALELVDETQISLRELIAFRKREEEGRNKADYSKMRHAYAGAVAAHVAELRRCETAFLRAQANAQFRREMQGKLADLSEAVTGNRRKLILAPVLVSTVVALGAGAVHAQGGDLHAALIGGLTGAFGASAGAVAEKLAKLYEQGFGYSQKQRELMAANPMAYMYKLAQARARAGQAS